MQLSDLLKILKQYVNSLLDREGWSIAFELKEEVENKITLKIRDRFTELAKEKLNLQATSFSIPSFTEIFEQQEDVARRIETEDLLKNIEPYNVYTFKQSLLRELNDIFVKNSQLTEIYKIAQDNNYSYINSFSAKNFFSIESIELKEIKGAKEVYLLGENGDGKSLVLMALHLAFNGREIDKNTNLEYTGKIKEILKANISARLSAKDTDGTKYGGEKIVFLKNFYSYGVHRGRYSSDKYEQYGFMSLYDADLQLYSPERLLTQIFLLEMEKKLDLQNMSGEDKDLPNWIPLKTIQNLFQELLESNVTIDVTTTGVKFKEKGFELSFSQLSEGYKNIMVWVSDLIYRFQQNQPKINRLADFKGVVLLDEIELHLHPIWQRRIIGQLRTFFPNIQFVFTTHSPTIIQGAAEEAVIYRIYRNPKTGKTSSSEAYFKKDLDHLMLNTLATSPLFGLDDARISEKSENIDTSDSFIQSKIRQRVDEELKRQKQEGKEFLTDAEIDILIDKIIQEESKKKNG
jgi:predicted ATP-binding protein involved in virulence